MEHAAETTSQTLFVRPYFVHETRRPTQRGPARRTPRVNIDGIERCLLKKRTEITVAKQLSRSTRSLRRA